MPTFLHLPSQTIIEATTAAQSSRYRRSHRFTELPNDTDYHYQSPTSPSNSTPDTPDHTPESPDTHTIAPDSPSDPSPTPTTTQPPTGTVSQVLAWVDNNPARARQALQAEQAGRNRITLLAKLRRIR